VTIANAEVPTVIRITYSFSMRVDVSDSTVLSDRFMQLMPHLDRQRNQSGKVGIAANQGRRFEV